MMREASAPVEAYSEIKSWRASSVVGTSNTNGMDALYGIGKTKRENMELCEYDPSLEEMLKPWRHEGVGSEVIAHRMAKQYRPLVYSPKGTMWQQLNIWGKRPKCTREITSSRTPSFISQ